MVRVIESFIELNGPSEVVIQIGTTTYKHGPWGGRVRRFRYSVVWKPSGLQYGTYRALVAEMRRE